MTIVHGMFFNALDQSPILAGLQTHFIVLVLFVPACANSKLSANNSMIAHSLTLHLLIYQNFTSHFWEHPDSKIVFFFGKKSNDDKT